MAEVVDPTPKDWVQPVQEVGESLVRISLREDPHLPLDSSQGGLGRGRCGWLFSHPLIAIGRRTK